MSQTINRMYDSFERASAAAEALLSHRLTRFTLVHVVGPHGRTAPAQGQAALSYDDIVNELMKAYVLRAHAKVLAKGIERGNSVVTVHAAFGTAVDAIETLEAHGPIDSGLAEPTWPAHAWDDAAPLSSLFGGIAVRSKDPTPFATFWSLPTLVAKGRTTFSGWGLPELSSSAAPLSSSLGLPLLSNKAAPLSGLIGLPLLAKSSAKSKR